MSEVVVDGHDITGEVCEALSGLWHSELARAEAAQRELMKQEWAQTNGERRNMSFGRLRMRVAPEVYNFWAAKLGAECWKDKSFLNWLEKRFGSLVSVKSRSTKTTIPR